MGNTHGSKAAVYYNGNRIYQWLNGCTTSRTRDKADATVFRTEHKRYTMGQSETMMTPNGFFSGGVAEVDELMEAAVKGDDSVWTHFPQGPEFGLVGYSLMAVTAKYDVTSEIGSSVGVAIEASNGKTGQADRGFSLALEEVIAGGADESVSLDLGAAQTRPGAFIAHAITDGTGTLDVRLQDSADNAVFADVVTLQFSGGTVPLPLFQADRDVTSGNLRRYVKATWTGNGTVVVAMVGKH